MVGWFVVLGLASLWDSISVYIGPSPREKEKEKRMIGERKMSKQPPLAPTASAIRPCPTIIQISRTPRRWKFTQHHRSTRPPLKIDQRRPFSHITCIWFKWILVPNRNWNLLFAIFCWYITNQTVFCRQTKQSATNNFGLNGSISWNTTS